MHLFLLSFDFETVLCLIRSRLLILPIFIHSLCCHDNTPFIPECLFCWNAANYALFSLFVGSGGGNWGREAKLLSVTGEVNWNMLDSLSLHFSVFRKWFWTIFWKCNFFFGLIFCSLLSVLLYSSFNHRLLFSKNEAFIFSEHVARFLSTKIEIYQRFFHCWLIY